MSSVVRLRRHGWGHLVGEDGVALVEFAFVLPVLLLLVLGIIDFGKAFNYKNDETHLANEAARYAAVNNSPVKDGSGNPVAGSLNTYMENTAPASDELKFGGGSIDSPGGVTVTFAFLSSPAPANHCIGDPVKVTVQAHYQWLSFLTLRGALPTLGATITSSATMRLEKKWTGNAVSGVHSGTDSYDVVPNSATGTCP